MLCTGLAYRTGIPVHRQTAVCPFPCNAVDSGVRRNPCAPSRIDLGTVPGITALVSAVCHFRADITGVLGTLDYADGQGISEPVVQTSFRRRYRAAKIPATIILLL